MAPKESSIKMATLQAFLKRMFNNKSDGINQQLSDDNLDKLVANSDSANMEKFLNPQHVIHIVVLDKKDTANRMFRFKTAIGKLNFKQIPW